jgi:hypothetical protein
MHPHKISTPWKSNRIYLCFAAHSVFRRSPSLRYLTSLAPSLGYIAAHISWTHTYLLYSPTHCVSHIRSHLMLVHHYSRCMPLLHVLHHELDAGRGPFFSLVLVELISSVEWNAFLNHKRALAGHLEDLGSFLNPTEVSWMFPPKHGSQWVVQWWTWTKDFPLHSHLFVHSINSLSGGT